MGDLMRVADARNWATRHYAVFFWMGVIMTIACLALVLAGNTEMFYRLERSSVPLSWAFGAVAIVEFLFAEICHRAEVRRTEDARTLPVGNLDFLEF
jgi:hypothetical protein